MTTETLQDDVSYTLEDIQISPLNYAVQSVAVGENALVTVDDGLAFGDGTVCDSSTKNKVDVGDSVMGYKIPPEFKQFALEHPEAIKWFIRLMASSMGGDFEYLDVFNYEKI